MAAQSRGIPAASSQVFIAFRFFQCLLVLLAAGVYFRRLSLPPVAGALGLSALAWGMALSLYNSDLSFSVFFDLAFYLLAAIFILEQRPWWVTLLMLPAALNRETSVLIPFLLGVHAYFRLQQAAPRRSALLAAAAGLLIYAAIFCGLRLFYGPQPFLSADGYSAGLALLLVNLKRSATWQQLMIVLGVMPVLAALAYRSWPASLRLFFWVRCARMGGRPLRGGARGRSAFDAGSAGTDLHTGSLVRPGAVHQPHPLPPPQHSSPGVAARPLVRDVQFDRASPSEIIAMTITLDGSSLTIETLGSDCTRI